MATNFAADISSDDLTERRTQLSFEHRFFRAVAVLFPLITIIGFAPSYYFKTAFQSPPLPSLLVHTHGMVMSLWIVLFVVQTYLISSKRIKLHITLGTFGVVLAAAVIVVGFMTGYAGARRGSTVPGFTPTEFFIIPVGDMVVFALVFFAAIYYRKDAASHKRLMLVTVLNFLPPSIARLPLPFIADLGALWFIGVPVLLTLTLLLADTYRTGKLNRAFAAGAALMIVSGPARIVIARTDAWGAFAGWFLG